MTSTNPLSATPRSTPTRARDRMRTDRADLYAILDAAFVGHLGIVYGTDVHVLPTTYGRHEDTLYIHGSTGAQSLRASNGRIPICFTVSLVDGIVYARSVFNHSLNYRSAVIHGELVAVTDADERDFGLEILTEHVAPGSWLHTRLPDKKESAATAVAKLSLAEASVKVRTGPPSYQPRDLETDYWAGVLPIVTSFGTPEPCPLLPEGTPIPERVTLRSYPQPPAATGAMPPVGEPPTDD